MFIYYGFDTSNIIPFDVTSDQSSLTLNKFDFAFCLDDRLVEITASSFILNNS